MAAAALDVSEMTKWDAYEARVAKLPKRDRRNESRASPQTLWIQEAMAEWYGFYFERMAALGLPTENTLHRAALMLPRAPLGNVVPLMPEPPEKALAVEQAMTGLMDSRRRVLVACERYAIHGIERVARQLHMSVKATERYRDEARQSLADILRTKGWKVPHKE